MKWFLDNFKIFFCELLPRWFSSFITPIHFYRVQLFLSWWNSPLSKVSRICWKTVWSLMIKMVLANNGINLTLKEWLFFRQIHIIIWLAQILLFAPVNRIGIYILWKYASKNVVNMAANKHVLVGIRHMTNDHWTSNLIKFQFLWTGCCGLYLNIVKKAVMNNRFLPQ